MMVAFLFLGRWGRRWRLGREVGVKNVGYRFPGAVCLLFPDLHVLAAIGCEVRMSVFRGQLIDTHHVGQIARARDVYFAGLPAQRRVRAQKPGPRCVNSLLATDGRRVGGEQGGVIAVVRNRRVHVSGGSRFGPLRVEIAKRAFIRGARILRCLLAASGHK